ncbi:MAG: oligosaccharide flippase family protein [Verrucomicrobia bacterium]|nr:oligosaccharide flippase family protein [Verrucomicrobiota bacterium]
MDLIVSLKRNVLANYASQIYVTIIGVVTVPLYLHYMGAEAFGLVSFFAMLQVLFNLLDLGLTPTIARETARFSGGATDALSYRRLVRALEAIFLAVALGGGGAVFAAAGFIAKKWLKVQALPLDQVESAVQMMALGAALRWMAGLYRGAISGTERLVWLGGYSAAVATVRFVGVLPVMMFFGAAPKVFFIYQVLIALAELAGLAVKTYGLLPHLPKDQGLGWSFAPIRPVLKFSLTIAFTSSVWVLVTQTDKLVLSKLLSLTEYGYFTLAVLGASGVTAITSPLSSALTPRLARLEAQGDHVGLIKLYRDATQFVGVIALPMAFTLAACAEKVMWAWTGDLAVVKAAAPILQLYALGNGVLALGAFPYYLQFAKGDLRLHLIGNAVFVMLLFPSLVWATWKYGGLGAGWAWFGSNMLFFFGYIPLVHQRFEPGLHWRWLKSDIFSIAVVALAIACLTQAISRPTGPRVEAIIISLVSGGLGLLGAMLASTFVRQRVINAVRSKFCVP